MRVTAAPLAFCSWTKGNSIIPNDDSPAGSRSRCGCIAIPAKEQRRRTIRIAMDALALFMRYMPLDQVAQTTDSKRLTR